MDSSVLVIETLSPVLPWVIGIGFFVTVFLVTFVISFKTSEWSTVVLLGGFANVIITALFIGISHFIVNNNHNVNVVEEIEQHYGVSLYDNDGNGFKNSWTTNVPNTQEHGYDFVHFHYDGDLFTDARIDKVSVDEDSIQYTLMFNPDSNSSDSMEEFSPDLVETGNGDSMEEVDLESDNE